MLPQVLCSVGSALHIWFSSAHLVLLSSSGSALFSGVPSSQLLSPFWFILSFLGMAGGHVMCRRPPVPIHPGIPVKSGGAHRENGNVKISPVPREPSPRGVVD